MAEDACKKVKIFLCTRAIHFSLKARGDVRAVSLWSGRI